MGVKRIPSNRFCVACDSNNGDPQWRFYDNNWFCANCYDKYVRDRREYRRKRYLKTGSNRICFKYKLYQLPECPRKGVCSSCHKKIGDTYINWEAKEAVIKRTHMHHQEYHEGDVLKDAVELCVSCHMKESRRLGSHKHLDRVEENRVCGGCDSTTTYTDKNGKQHWHRWDGVWLCHECRSRYIDAPICHQKFGTIHNKRYNVTQ